MVNSRAGTYTPSPAQQTIITGISHSPHGSHHSTFSASASPSTNSPTGGSSSLVKIIIAQAYLLLGTIRQDDKDRTKWDQLQKLIDDNGMEVFQKYFTRMVVANAGHIFPGHNRSTTSAGNHQLLVTEILNIKTDVNQAEKIAEAIETANEDLFRDFDLSTFMEHFKLDALEKTILALAFKLGSRPDLRTKADAILSMNFTPFVQLLALNEPGHQSITPAFLATIIDRYIQLHPPNFDQIGRDDLVQAVHYRYSAAGQDTAPPTEILSALYLINSLKRSNPLIAAIRNAGPTFTVDEETCRRSLRNARIDMDEEIVSAALIYTAISQTPSNSPSILISAIRKEATRDLNWRHVVEQFDQPELRVTKEQFLSLYIALRPLAASDIIDIQEMWGAREEPDETHRNWHNSETQLSFIAAFSSLSPDQLDATTVPGLEASFKVEDLAGADDETQAQAAQAVRHPLVSLAAVKAMFQVALQSPAASDTIEAKRLFQQVVVPNLHIFLVSAVGVPGTWPDLASETINSLFERFVYKYEPAFDLVLERCWRNNKQWVVERLADAHAKQPLEVQHILEHAIKHGWTQELVTVLSGFGLDLAALAHANGLLDLDEWSQNSSHRPELARALLTFLGIKAQHELAFQRSENDKLHSVMLPVKTVSAFLDIVSSILPTEPTHDLIAVQRACIKAYPRLINYGEGFDDIINANGAERNSLPEAANMKMEEHYKLMYSEDLQVRAIVEALGRYKHSRDPSDQDVFACMIHGLFDEYELYSTYPLEALATTAVLFGGIISHKLISELPLEIGLGMILEAVRDHPPDEAMYKFGLQALMQLFSRLHEWPGFCRQLLQVPGLRGTEAYNKAEQICRVAEQEDAPRNGPLNGGGMTNGNIDEVLAAELTVAPFASLHVDLAPQGISENLSDDAQEKVQFVLNNITGENLKSKFDELKDIIEEKHQQWLAEHIVNTTAKTMPNYHKLYLDLVALFGKKSMWAELLRETYITVIRMLNSELKTPVERSHLKNLGTWLGSVTLARDKPILYKNIAFKDLLFEAFDSERLAIVVPFVCKVLIQGQLSTVFKPPNSWLMEIVHLLIELYHNAELKLNLKFEIEVLCKELKLDHKTIEPSNELSCRVPPVEEATEPIAPDMMDRFDNISLNGLGGGTANGRFSPQEIASSIPDLGPLLTYPPGNDMVNQSQLHEILKSAITRAVHEIIAPVVERSVTIAAISTAQMIHKDFATEPDESRVRSAAINMVKKTAGSLALVTSKEPLRASMTNYIRTLAQTTIPQGLPEGTIIMCVNSNLELACSQVERKAEERAVPEIEEMIEGELETRRHWNMTRPEDSFMSPDLTRWSLTIPDPYKLQPSPNGLNDRQMNIYEEFARQPRQLSLGGTTHVASASDATRAIGSDILQDQYSSVASLPQPQERSTIAHLNTQQPNYAPPNSTMPNGRISNLPNNPQTIQEKVQAIFEALEEEAEKANVQHYSDLPRPHDIFLPLDALYSLLIRCSQGPEAFDLMIVDSICQKLFGGTTQVLVIESLVKVLDDSSRIGGRTASRVAYLVGEQSGEDLLSVPLVIALINARMVEWRRVDAVTSKALEQSKEGSMEFFSSLLDNVLLNDRPLALYNDFSRSLEFAWRWIEEDSSLEAGQVLKEKLQSSGLPQAVAHEADDLLATQKEQMNYVFDEWVHLCINPNANSTTATHFIAQLYNKQVINSMEDLCLFLRLAIDNCVDRFESPQIQTVSDAYASSADALARLVVKLVIAPQPEGEVKGNKAAFLRLILSVCVLVLNHHHIRRGDAFNQKIFVRLFSTMLTEMNYVEEELSTKERKDITIVFATIFKELQPSFFPGFIFGWLSLVSHRDFLPVLMRIPEDAGWKPYASIMGDLMSYLGELLKSPGTNDITEVVYHGTLKLLLVLQHDYPEFLAAHHSQLLSNIPSHCTYLYNMILTANPAKFSKLPDPFQPGLKVDRLPEIRQSQQSQIEAESTLRQSGLFDLLEQALQNSPGEDVIAAIAHEIQIKRRQDTGFCHVPINVDIKLIEAVVAHIGAHSIAKANETEGPNFLSNSPAAILLSMLARELRPEARYNLLNSIVNQIRFPNNETHFFSQALLEIWGRDLNDPEETDVRQQITRILLERLLTSWPQPWGLNLVCVELIKNDTYNFFQAPFIKSAPEIGERFVALTRNMAVAT